MVSAESFDPGQLPITPLRQANGEWLRLEIDLPGYSVWLRAWQVQVGRATLYLLDSNDAANFPAHRGITSELYGGGPELRLKQELLLGIGGWRLLGALGIQPDVCHLNEGHPAFAVLERARSFMQETAQPFEVALAVTRAGNLFTSHTAVAAGFDRSPTAWVKRMRESMARLTPRFSANRTVREYTEQHYFPAATVYHLRSANKGAIGRQIVDWRHSLERKWATLHFGEVKVETRGEQHVFDVHVYLDDLDPKAVRVELYADGVMGSAAVRQEMTRVRQLVGAPGTYVYNAAVSAARPPGDYTARVMPHCAGVAIPLEEARILWQR